MRRSVYHFLIEEGDFYLETGAVLETLHREMIGTRMVSIPFEGLNEKDSLQEIRGDLEDPRRVSSFSDMEDLLVGVKVVGVAFDNAPISEMSDDLILYPWHGKSPLFFGVV